MAIGHKDGESLEQDLFTTEEIGFAQQNGLTLERRFSATAGEKYLANICTGCDQMQGNWFLYMDPFHDRFNLLITERQNYGPCDKCATYYCLTHGEYLDYRGTNQCPACLDEAERVMCPNNPDRDCFYPDRCQQNGCYFVNQEQQRRLEQQEWERQQKEWQRQQPELREQQENKNRQEQEQRQQEWAELNEWFRKHRNQ